MLLGRNRISTEAQAGIRQGWKAEKRDLIGSDPNNWLGAQEEYRAHLGHEQLTTFVQTLLEV